MTLEVKLAANYFFPFKDDKNSSWMRSSIPKRFDNNFHQSLLLLSLSSTDNNLAILCLSGDRFYITTPNHNSNNNKLASIEMKSLRQWHFSNLNLNESFCMNGQEKKIKFISSVGEEFVKCTRHTFFCILICEEYLSGPSLFTFWSLQRQYNFRSN